MRVSYDRPSLQNAGPRHTRGASPARGPQPQEPQPEEEMAAVAAPPQVSRRDSAAAQPQAQSRGHRNSWLAALFVALLGVPLIFYIGPLRLTPYRLFLLVIFVPAFFAWISGKAGRLRVVDGLVLAFCVWNSLSLLVNHGASQIEFAGITFVESFGAFLVARWLVRGPDDLQRIVKVLFWMMLLFIPAAIIEATTEISIYNRFFDLIGEVYTSDFYDVRWGMKRAQVVFEHPILYGVFCASSFSLIYLLYDPVRQRVAGLRRAWAPFVAVFWSLSTGAFLPIFIQIGFLSWDRILRALKMRWKLLAGLFVLGWVTVDLLSSRTPFEVFISYMTFNSNTSFYRIMIFRYGMDNVWANPVWGIGLSDWARPAWMTATTVDNFWLLMAMRQGILSFFFILLAYIWVLFSIGRLTLAADPQAALQRNAMIYSLIGVGVSLCTVHVWNATFSWLLFMIGACLWLPDHAAGLSSAPAGEVPASRRRVSTRRALRPARA